MAQAEPARGRTGKLAGGAGPTSTTSTAFAEVILAPGALRTVFQPIIRCSTTRWTLHALECLTRGPAGSPYATAASLFGAARRWQLESQVDRACVITALETAARHQIDAALFINVSPLTLASDRGLPEFLAATAARCHIPRTRLTVEVIEHGRDCDAELQAAAIRSLKEMGVRVAFDDVGAVGADSRALRACPCRPDILKIDGRLFRAAGQGRARRRVASFIQEARHHGVDLIAEGVERESDARLACSLGIELVQGYYLCRPLSADAVTQRLRGISEPSRWIEPGHNGEIP